MKVFYEFVGGPLNRCLLSRNTVEALADGKSRNWAADRARGFLAPRAELDDQPTVKGYVGPMWDGLRYDVNRKLRHDFETTQEEREGLEPIAILRYETQKVYDMLCR